MLNPTRSPLHPTFIEARIFVRPATGEANAQAISAEHNSSVIQNTNDADWMRYCVAQYLI